MFPYWLQPEYDLGWEWVIAWREGPPSRAVRGPTQSQHTRRVERRVIGYIQTH